MKRETALVLALTAAIACSPDASQHAHPTPVDPAPTVSKDLAPQDRDFLERAAQGNNAEIATGGLVSGRALRPEVVEFGKMMVTDHTAANRQLAAIAAQYHIVIPTTLGDQQQGYDSVVSRRLDPFDREFMRVMIGNHQAAAELFRNEAAGGADPALKAYAATLLPKIEMHLARAKALSDIAAAPQELSTPPSPSATEPPPASTEPATTPVQNEQTPVPGRTPPLKKPSGETGR